MRERAEMTSTTPARPTMLITGGSRGIGAAVARLGAAVGHNVVISYAGNESAAASVVADVQAVGASALAVRCDVAVESDVVGLFEAAIAEFGRIDSVIANAGVIAPITRVEDMTIERIERILAVNVTGCLITCREAVRHMSTSRGGAGGSIVINSSAASRLGSPNEFVDYAASKGATDSITIGLAKEVATDGIRVNAVRPGLIETTIHADAGRADRVEALAPNVPMARGGSADEVAEAILWLVSDASSYVTGTFIDVTGGR